MNFMPPVRMRPTLEHLPLPLLATPMGTGGVGLAWRHAHHWLGAPAVVGEALLAFTTMLWAFVLLLQAMRAVRHPHAIVAELRHPVRVAFGAAPTIGLMMVAAFLFPYAPGLGALLWGVAVVLHLFLAALLLRRVVAGRGDPSMLAPPLLIPLVGNILAPAIGARMGFVDASWMMFGVGLILWLAVLPLLLHRLFAGPALPPPLRPTLVILLAPPTVAALAVEALTGRADAVALSFAGVALLIAAVMISLAAEFARAPFGLAWWGVTFPTAAFAVMVMAIGAPAWMGWAALLTTTGLTGLVAWRTLEAALAGGFFRPEY